GDRDKCGVTEADLAAAVTGPKVRALMTYEVDRASALLDEGAPLVGTLHGAARLAVAGYLAGGRAALAAIRAADYDVLAVTPHPDKRVTARLAIQAYLRGRWGTWTRLRPTRLVRRSPGRRRGTSPTAFGCCPRANGSPSPRS